MALVEKRAGQRNERPQPFATPAQPAGCFACRLRNGLVGPAASIGEGDSSSSGRQV